VPAILHLLGIDAIASAYVVVDDVLALDDRGIDGVTHSLVARRDVLDDVDADKVEALGERLLPIAGPGAMPELRDLVLADALTRTLREQRTRHGAVAIHAHGPHARSVAALVGRSIVMPVIVDAGDERPGHRVLPPPTRSVYASHGDLDRALEAGLVAREAAIVPPGIDTALPNHADGDDGDDGEIVVSAAPELAPQLGAALDRRGLRLEQRLTAGTVGRARVVVVGPMTHLCPGVVAAVAAGIPTVGLDVPWADDLAGCAAFLPRPHLDLEELLLLARRRRWRPRRLPRALGRAARTEALHELYGAVVGPRVSLHPPGRRRRR
jgi:hypothetical protein